MRTIQQAAALRSYVTAAKENRAVVGFVPTMGALHDGHLSLVKRAKSDCDVVVMSVFVNPTQFGPGEDFERYPRDLQRDSMLAQQAGVDMLFAPTVEEIYPANACTFVEVEGLTSRWEGALRPGHFRGVATVVTKLLNIVRPDNAYFGQKDYQQLKVLERMVADLYLPVKIVPVAIHREADGLAMSSRNAYLTPDQRNGATVLHRALTAARQQYDGGETSAAKLESAMREVLETQAGLTIDYAVVVHADTLEPIDAVNGHAVALLAVRLGATRLIDNIVLGQPDPKPAGRPRG